MKSRDCPDCMVVAWPIVLDTMRYAAVLRPAGSTLVPDARDRSRDQWRRRSCLHADITAVNINWAAASVFPSSNRQQQRQQQRHGDGRFTDGGRINATRRTQSVIRKLIDYLFVADLHPVRSCSTLLQLQLQLRRVCWPWLTLAVSCTRSLAYELADTATIQLETYIQVAWVISKPFKVQWRQIVTFPGVQCHPGLTYIFYFWHSGTLALRAEPQSAQMSEIKNAG